MRNSPITSRWPRPLVIAIMAATCLGFALWIGYLSVKLPSTYRAENWDVVWIGFDTALLISFAATTITMYQKRSLAITFAIISSTLLFTDAWFDVVTSHSGAERIWAILTALCLEIPLALTLATFSHRRIKAAIVQSQSAMRSDSQLD